MSTLGLDLGTNSIGWAILEGTAKDPSGVIALGSRIFADPLEPKSKEPLNVSRRNARGQRKLIARRRLRKELLRRQLVAALLLPPQKTAQEDLMNDHAFNPYALRRKALDDALTLHEFGRCLFHLCVRRGFKSNRKAAFSHRFADPDVMAILEEEEAGRLSDANEPETKESQEDRKETEQVKKAIGELKAQMQLANARTLGEFFALQLDAGGKARRTDGETANTERSQYEEEFELIWEAQAKHHPRVLTERLKAQVYQTIFFQRPLKIQRFTKEVCRFETNRTRAMKAHPIAQEFRIWQTINNIRVRQPDSWEERPLSTDERQKAVQLLKTMKEASWAGLRKATGLKGLVINLEEGGESKIKGDSTAVRLRKVLGDRLDAMDQEAQENLTYDLLNIDLKDGLIKRLRGPEYGFDAKTAYLLATTELERGTSSLSVKAMRKLLPHLREGKRYDEACQLVGYLRPDQLDLEGLDYLPEPPSARNPVVTRCLYELRKVVNAIIRTHGKPDHIHVELARDIKLTKKQKEDIEKQNRINRAQNEKAREALSNHSAFIDKEPTHADLEKYRLWVESEETCPYTGRHIALAELYSQDWDVEHIIPYSRSFDDSFRNKTLCYAPFNRSVKKNRTPREAMEGTPEYDQMLQRVMELKYMKKGKKALFQREVNEEDVDKFLNRQLVDTQYISRLAREYLSQLGVEVQVANGSATAALRHKWGLNTILGEDGAKNRDDHRHHAIDAVVIALTSRSLFQRLSTISSKIGGAGLKDHDLHVPEPFAGFRQRVAELVDLMIVSHRVDHKIRGALHEDTGYGKIGPGHYVTRKAITALTNGELERVRDASLRKLIEPDGDKRKKLDPARPLVITDRHGKEHVIKRVRIDVTKGDEKMVGIKDVGGSEYRFHPKGSNHHVEVLTNADGDRKYLVISMIEAARRAAAGKPVIQQDHGPDWRLLMAFHANDVLRCEGLPHELYRAVSFSPAKPVYLVLRQLDQAGETKEKLGVASAKPRTDVLLQSDSALKSILSVVNVDVLGQER